MKSSQLSKVNSDITKEKFESFLKEKNRKKRRLENQRILILLLVNNASALFKFFHCGLYRFHINFELFRLIGGVASRGKADISVFKKCFPLCPCNLQLHASFCFCFVCEIVRVIAVKVLRSYSYFKPIFL